MRGMAAEAVVEGRTIKVFQKQKVKVEKVGYQALSLRHLPSRKRSSDQAPAGFFRCFGGLCGRG